MTPNAVRRVFICIFINAVFSKVCFSAGSWSYDNHHGDGPGDWKKSHPDCGKTQQSPIDIRSSASKYQNMKALHFDGYDTPPGQNSYKLINNGHTVQLNIDRASMTITSGDLPGKFKLVQFHLHWGSTNAKGSEHTVNGKHYPMEIHFVHFNERYGNVDQALDKADGLAVLGVFFEIGDKSHPIIDHLIEKFCNIKYAGTNSSDIPVFKMEEILPSQRNAFYRYNGSLTTPGCKEIVTWTVLKDTVKISQAQMNAFRALCHNAKGGHSDDPLVDNFRPIQSLGSRVLLRNHEEVLTPDTNPTNNLASTTTTAVDLLLAATVLVGSVLR